MAIQALVVNAIAAIRTKNAFSMDVESVIEKLALGAAAYANDLICKHFHRQILSGFTMCEKELLDKSDESVSNMVFRTSEEQLQMLVIFKQFLVGVANLLSKFDDLSLEFHQNIKAKEELIEQTVAFVRSSSSKFIADCKLKIFDVILVTVIARNSENDKILLSGQLKKINDANRSDDASIQIRIRLICGLLKLPVSQWCYPSNRKTIIELINFCNFQLNLEEVDNLLQISFAELTLSEHGRQFLLSFNGNAKISIRILEKLQSFVRAKVLNLETLSFVLDVIAGCNEAALSLAVNLILDEFLLHSNQDYFNRSILLKRTYSIFDELLKRLVGDDGLPDMEVFENAITADMIDRLTKLKEKNMKKEL